MQLAGGSYLNEALGCFQHQNSGENFAAFLFVFTGIIAERFHFMAK